MTNMIEITGLTKSFGSMKVLRNVDLTAGQGRIMAIVGPNGAGKTTLIKALLGLTHADAGKIVIGGVRIGRGDEYRSRIGYMPQIGRFPDNLTGNDLIAMLKDLRRGSGTLDGELLESLELAPHMDRPLRLLSGGMKQRVNAVMAFLFSPELLVLDEPTAGLDPLSSSILKDKILAERSQGKTFVLTSHIMSELEELVDDVAFLLDGNAPFVGSLDELKRVTHQTTLERAAAALMTRRAVERAA